MKTSSGLARFALIAAGTISVALGVLGMILPVLPTTPFLLLATVCYARSSKRFHHWLLANRWCGVYIRNYREGKGIRRQHKSVMITLLWLTTGSSALLVESSWWVRLALLVVAAGVTTHLVRIKTFGPATQPGKTSDRTA